MNMKSKHKFLTAVTILLLSASAWAAPVPAGQVVTNTFEALNRQRAEKPTVAQVAAGKEALGNLLDREYLQKKLLGDLPRQLSAEEQNKLFGAIEEVLTVWSLKGLQKQAESKKEMKKPEAVETATPDGLTLTYKFATPRGEREVNCEFALVNDSYRLRDILFGKKSMVNIFQKKLKKSLKKQTVEEYIADLRKNGFELPQDKAHEEPQK